MPESYQPRIFSNDKYGTGSRVSNNETAEFANGDISKIDKRHMTSGENITQSTETTKMST